MTDSKHLVGITACPSGVAHTYLAAESLQNAAQELGYTMDVETHGSIGVENELTADAISRADAVVIAADKSVDLSRFAGKKVVTARAADGIHKPQQLINDALAAQPLAAQSPSSSSSSYQGSSRMSGGGVGASIYNNLMNGVSHMIPFVVVGGLFLAFALSMSGQASVPKDGLAKTVWDVGVLGFTLMVPILSGFIAYAIADRPGLAPGMITGLLATSPAIYHSEASAGFLGGLITGFASGYVALAIKRIKVHKYIAPVMPIIVIPVFTTLIVGGLFIFLLGGPIGAIYTGLTAWLNGMTGAGVITLGIILGLLTGFDLGGPVNKVAYVTTGALIASGNYIAGAMNGVAVAVPPIGLAIAAFVAHKYFTDQERQNGIAAAAMGFFGITEGAIPFAAARPLQIIPANMIGSAAGAATAGALMVQNRIWWGGPIVAILGGTSNALLFLVSLLVGCLVTAGVAIGLIALTSGRKGAEPALATAAAPAVAAAPRVATTPARAATATTATRAAAATAVAAPAAAAAATTASRPTEATISDYLSTETIALDTHSTDRDSAIRDLVALAARTGRITDVDQVAAAAIGREAEFSTAVGNEIAIPHAKTDAVAQPVVAFARNVDGIDWKSPSKDLARLLFLIAVPAAAAGNEHLRILAKLSRALAKPAFREGLAGAQTSEQVLALVREYCG